MEELNVIKVINTEGKEIEIKEVATLQKPGDEKKMIIYTFDDKAENVDLYAAIINKENDSYVLESISEKEDWELIQKAISELSE